jgi:hypothetical protein
MTVGRETNQLSSLVKLGLTMCYILGVVKYLTQFTCTNFINIIHWVFANIRNMVNSALVWTSVGGVKEKDPSEPC